MLWSLGNEGTIPVVFAKTNKRGIPAISLLISMLGGVFSLLTSVYATDTIYLVLVSISGLAVVWWSSSGWRSPCASSSSGRSG
ncbi:hypothetical protein ME0900_04000 [Lactobacillus delbrueckii subsp. bulgaricus]|uniref:Amino acid permease/ SLC12A domain-containing protein n=1 Tax=Lactobacillus delbrueckii subsp. bulgaricus TaxID=1585 RepID=A0AAV5PDT0_LACDE|nr:hypothetical protein ME0899_07260 [Lactobacillus delbrueckii subsp. bulgaricus]GMB86028.1 hypothetical protein ME0900_04000 [Lactobacillus delbrueckii subsp. bulgaricus]